LVDGRGLPLVVALTPGQAHDSPALPRLLDELRVPRLGPGRPRTTPTALRADKAYSGRNNRDRRKAKGSAGGRPLDFDAEDYKNRNVVERSFNKFKDWRGLATRYDKHAQTYRGGMVLASIVLWLS